MTLPNLSLSLGRTWFYEIEEIISQIVWVSEVCDQNGDRVEVVIGCEHELHPHLLASSV